MFLHLLFECAMMRKSFTFQPKAMTLLKIKRCAPEENEEAEHHHPRPVDSPDHGSRSERTRPKDDLYRHAVRGLRANRSRTSLGRLDFTRRIMCLNRFHVGKHAGATPRRNPPRRSCPSAKSMRGRSRGARSRPSAVYTILSPDGCFAAPSLSVPSGEIQQRTFSLPAGRNIGIQSRITRLVAYTEL
jgi:hypothetical protein